MTIVIRFIKIEIILFNIIDVMTYSINVNIFKLKFIKYFKIAQFRSYIDIVFTTKNVFFVHSIIIEFCFFPFSLII